jgi:hypothetical protein
MMREESGLKCPSKQFSSLGVSALSDHCRLVIRGKLERFCGGKSLKVQ